MIKLFKSIIVVLLLVISPTVFSQKITPFHSWKTKVLAKANSARRMKDVSFQEKKVIFYINLARMNGALFVETYLKDYREDVRIPKNKYYRSLVKTLREQEALPPLLPQEDLFKEAIKHAKEMGRVGKKGHRSANHKSFDERMKKLKKKYKKMKESNQYGYPDALSIVIDLLIDDDKESLIHRKTLLHKDLKYIGIGIRSHKKYRINTSLLFGGELIEIID
ncbi:MAG: CAP domain-containing protein [Flavobacteriales bacterium]|nr:CAP domain-containing protein [Flavobacteriales bacterium]